MRAWTFNTRGPLSEALKLRHDLPQPQPKHLAPDEVLVKVSHSSLFQPLASFVGVIPHFNDKYWIPGLEFSGIVVADGGVRPGESSLEGQAVFGMIGPKLYRKYNGVLVEYVVAPKAAVVSKPANASFEETSGISGGGATSVGLFEKAELLEVGLVEGEYRISSLAEGKRILVTGGSTGTGLSVLQIAKMLVGPKGKIVTTCSRRNIELVRSHGADEIIDYTKHPDFHEYLTTHYSSTPFDAIIDISGSDPVLYQHSPAYLKPTGPFAFAGNMSRTHANPNLGIFGVLGWFVRLVSLVLMWNLYSIWPVMLGGVPRRSFFFSGQPNARNLSIVRQLVEDGILRGVVDSVWDMEDVLKAFDYLGKGRVSGKVVVKVWK